MAPSKRQVQEVAPGISPHPLLNMEPTDLQKFGQDSPVTLLAVKRVRVPKKKGPKRPKKTKK